MLFRAAGIEKESIVDGPGIRMAVFFQGCNHKCNGCHNPETWDFNGGKIMKTSDVIEMYKRNMLYSGITLTGGDPLYQPYPALELAQSIHELGGNVWLYTGFEITKELADIEVVRNLILNVDTIVDGPFILEERDLGLEFRGSRNQRILTHDNIIEIISRGY